MVSVFDNTTLTSRPLFTCSAATGRPLAAPTGRLRESRDAPLGWADVAAGIMLSRGTLEAERKGGGWHPKGSGGIGWRAKLERELLLRARRTWMPMAPGLDLLLMPSCEQTSGTVPPPQWWERHEAAGGTGVRGAAAAPPAPATPSVRWVCYSGADRLGVALWRKTAALLEALYGAYPSKSFYLKLDSDTLVLPRSLLRFLASLRANARDVSSGAAGGEGGGLADPLPPLYFGSNRIASKDLFCTRPHCLVASDEWARLEERHRNLSVAPARRQTVGSPAPRIAPSGASYAQGGAYGFDRRALAALVAGRCMQSVAEAVAAAEQRQRRGAAGAARPAGDPLRLYEDEAVGLCMLLRGVRLTTCGCFYDWGPCDIINKPEGCHADTDASKLCRLPLTVHKLRQLEWFDGWWRLLSAREPRALDELDRWEASAVGVDPTDTSPSPVRRGARARPVAGRARYQGVRPQG